MARRVLLLVTDLLVGGTPTIVRELAVGLQGRPGIEVQVASLAEVGPVGLVLREAGVEVHALGARGPRDVLAAVRSLAGLVRRQRLDTVFSFLLHANAIAAAAGVMLRGVRFLQSIQTTQPWPRWHWSLQRWAHHAAERVIVPSPSVARVARAWAGIPGGKIGVIANAVDPEQFADIGRGVGPERLEHIGFIGRLDPVKRIGDLVRAVPLLGEGAHLHIFGDGPDRPRIEELVRSLGLGRRVTLHGTIARPQEALGRVGVLALPSSAEGFGLVLIEAMAAGVPVVGTDVPGIRDVVQHERTGLLVRPGRPEDLAAAILRLRNDAPLRARLIEGAAAEVERRFSWQVVLPQYEQLLTGRRGPA